ncbi:hypothetical protein [Gynuella sp.]|uniref:hypothetical protein n=1 Tax=Gynuella sp. TaxID=2969146 RepID=UPI003D0AD7A9
MAKLEIGKDGLTVEGEEDWGLWLDFTIWLAAKFAYLWKHNPAKAAKLWFQYQKVGGQFRSPMGPKFGQSGQSMVATTFSKKTIRKNGGPTPT